MVTFTLPEELRSLARSNQKAVYNILFRASADALLELASDPRFVGGRIGMVGVLHTWTRDLFYHPHVHYIATGGGLSSDGRWFDSRKDFLVHVKPLSVLFRAKFRDQLKKTDLFHLPVGAGEGAFKYLAPYIFRVAISNKRILNLEDGKVTFSYKESATDQIKFSTVPAEEFIRRFLQHVLPDHFVKVRYYGLLSPSNRCLLEKSRELLKGRSIDILAATQSQKDKESIAALRCPNCGGVLKLIQRLKPQPRSPP
jgi:Putative transposase